MDGGLIMLQGFRISILENIELYGVFLLLLVCFAIYKTIIKVIVLKDKLVLSTQKVNYLESCNKAVIVLYDDIRGFKHDFNNIVQVMGGYISMNDVEGLKSYYKNLTVDFQKVRNLNLLNLNEINDPALNSLVLKKYYVAKNNKIDINISSYANLKKINFNMYEYSRILGILLDNAIEAAENCSQKLINVKFYEENGCINCLIENTYNNENVNLNRIYEKNYSTKSSKANHGLGLWEVSELLKANPNISLETQTDGLFFVQVLSIKY